MKILVIGNGARESIIVEKLAIDSEVYAFMNKKNPQIAKNCKASYVFKIENSEKVKRKIQEIGIKFDLAFVSPDALLEKGISDTLIECGIKVASPSKKASRIEWDKSFMRELVKNHKIDGAIEYAIFDKREMARDFIERVKNVAIKPLGLTGGKGVKVSGDHFSDINGAMEYVDELLKKDGKVLIEEKVEGEEFSLMAFSDGSKIAPMPPIQDHKRAFVNDIGPNTGGMGTISTGKILPFLDKTDIDKAHKILQQVISALAKEDAQFKGILYGQFMATKGGIKIIEFNARFGDPEAMNALGLLITPLSSIMHSICEGKMCKVEFSEERSVVRYLVPKGYPAEVERDFEVQIDYDALKSSGAKIYFASVYEREGKIFTTNSRAFGILGVAKTLEEAQRISLEGSKAVKGEIWFREDIGTKSLVQKRIENMKKVRSR
jgi:phosphoribosylamine--glycine ligase